MMQHLHNGRNRRGFTLVEILVVIAIIAILGALAAWGAFAIIGNQQTRNTKSTIMVVDKVLHDHWKFVIEEAKKDPVISPAVQALAGGPALDPTGQRARVLWIKVRLMEAFPQSFSDIGTPPGVVPAVVPPVYTSIPGIGIPIPPNTPGIQQRYIADYQRKIPITVPWFSSTQPLQATNINTASSAMSPYMATPSSACLLIALSANRGGSSLRQDDIKFAVKDTDGDHIPEILDGWGHPLMFTRFDFSANVQAANPVAAGGRNAKYADPVDTDGMLLTPAWYASVWCGNVQSTCQYSIVSNNGTNANYVIPSVMSAGKDGVMGNGDDIYSYKLRGN